MTKQPNAIPLRPFLPADNGRSFRPPRTFLQRAVAAHVTSRAEGQHVTPEDVLLSRHGRDEASLMLVQQRAVSTVATTTGANWASQLAVTAVADFVLNLPQSAASKLIAESLTLNFGTANTISIPRLSGALPSVPFVDEGNPSPVVQVVLASTALTPSKMLVNAAFTGELARHSAAEAVITRVLEEACAVSLDAAIFSTTAASAIRPAGLLNGVTGATPTAGGNLEALTTDVTAIVGSVAAAGGVDIVLVAGASAAAALKVRVPELAIPVWPSRAIAVDTLIAIDAASFVSGFGPVPRIDTSMEAVVHFEDQIPLPISDVSGVASPSRSGFQSDFVVLKLVLDTAWGMRTAGRISIVAGITWS